MSWIESHQELGQHPKTRRLARQLGCSLPAAVGHLQYLWWWAVDYAPGGDLGRFEEGDIADAAMWEGDASEFLSALRSAGFLDGPNLHDWDDYAGRLISMRAANAQRARTSRERRAQRAGLQNTTEPDLTEQPDPEDLLPDPATAGPQEPTPIASSKRITESFRSEMRVAFPDLDEAAEFDKATNHVAYRKAIDKRKYYRNWLTNARKFNERRQNDGGTYRGNAHGRRTGSDGAASSSFADLGIPVVR